ncbi:MAG: hypothetical protein IJC73_05420 [Lentisphaeria bacterium]|nr:hypothetical protein [Lentisphaeria bacterium]
MAMLLTGPAAAGLEFVTEAAGQFRQSLLDNRDLLDGERKSVLGEMPPAKRKSLLAAKRRMIRKYAPHWEAEFAGYDRLLGWQEGDFLLIRSDVFEKSDCTSWIFAPDQTASGQMILQKCRDNRRARLGMSIQQSPGKLRWMRISNVESQAATFVMNECGFVLVMNNGDYCEDLAADYAFGSPGSLRLAAENCRNVEEGVALLTKMAEAGEILGGQIYQMIDPHRAAVVECGGRKTSVRIFERGWSCYANNWQSEAMRAISKVSDYGRKINRFREKVARDALQAARNPDGKVAWPGLFRAARTTVKDPRDVWRGPYCRTSLGSTLLIPDAEFPAYLSTAYVALGPQQHTVFLPVALGVTALPRPLISGDWGDHAIRAFKNSYLSPHVAQFEALEQTLIPEHLAVLESARQLLRQQRVAEAVALLDDNFRKQAAAVWQTLRSVDTSAGKQP